MTATHALHLLRHAKSSWDDRSLRDHARPLAPRGESGAEAIRRHLAASAVHVDLVVCSTAERTRQTWDRVAPGVTGDPQVRFVEELYEADADSMLTVLRGSGRAGSVLLVGHNPGISDLALGLAGNVEDPMTERIRAKYPTAALATFRITGPWSQLGYGRAHLEAFVRPRDLPPV